MTALRFVLDTPPNGNASVFREIDVLGAPIPIPEPSTFALSALGLLGLAFYGWRRGR